MTKQQPNRQWQDELTATNQQPLPQPPHNRNILHNPKYKLKTNLTKSNHIPTTMTSTAKNQNHNQE